MPNVNPGAARALTPNLQGQLKANGTTASLLYVNLPSDSGNILPGTLAYTTDQGMVYWNGSSWTSLSSGSGGGILGAYVNAGAVASGATNNYTPTGFPGTSAAPVSRLDISANAAGSNLTGLVAGTDGQIVVIFNSAAVGGGNLILNNLNAGSSSANQFQGGGGSDFILIPQSSLQLVYFAGSVNKWRTNA